MLTLVALTLAAATQDSSLYRLPQGEETRWVSPENRTGAKGAGARENKGAKGPAFDTIPVGGTHLLADIRRPGVIDRMWLTLDDRSPQALRGLVLRMWWDGADRPAVEVPLGDFFLHGAGPMVPMESTLLASPEGCSFVSYVAMPFRRDRAIRLGDDLRILARVEGRGRLLGAIVAVNTNPACEKTWWGEGEVRIALDGDRPEAPTLAGTGTEDYIGTAWGQGAYTNRYQGAPIATWDDEGRWTFYRFHVPDAVLFHRDIQVPLQQIGGARKNIVLGLQKKELR